MMTKGADLTMIERIDFSLNDFEEMRKFLEEDLS
jgi:hypothetical protein